MDGLARFTEAQRDVYRTALDELRAGRKRSHWMWFILPQIAGLGWSPMAHRYAIADLAEAKAYLAHPVLGRRLRECVAVVREHSGKTAHDIFGSPDDLKFRSCLTLFETAAPDEPLFRDALAVFYGAGRDPKTLRLLRRQATP